MKKLKSTSGESFAEVLVASVVISLGMILLVSMINASVRIISRSEQAFDNYYEAKNNYNTGNISSSDAQVVRVETRGVNAVNTPMNLPVNVKYAVSADGAYTFSTYEYRK